MSQQPDHLEGAEFIGTKKGSVPPGWPDWVDQFVLPYLREPSLRVIWLILLSHLVMAMSVAVVLSFRDHNPGGFFGMLLLAMVTIETVRLERVWHRRSGWMAGTIGLCWLASIGLSVLISSYGIL